MDVFSSLAVVGSTLGPLYLVDPEESTCSPLLDAIAALDEDEAGSDWPFVESSYASQLFGQMKDGLQGNRDDLYWEFRRLFALGPSPKPAPPWGSYYTDKEGAICSDATLKLRQWMSVNGVEVQGRQKKIEDHIGSLLLLMAWLAEHRPELLEDFLGAHLLPWSEHFLKLLGESTNHPFYHGLAELTNASLCGIRDALNLEISYPFFYR